jgi:hypothetical protein
VDRQRRGAYNVGEVIGNPTSETALVPTSYAMLRSFSISIATHSFPVPPAVLRT